MNRQQLKLRHEGGKGFLSGAVDRTSKLVFALIFRKATKLASVTFLWVLIKTVPYKIHTILTDNSVLSDCRWQAVERGVQFTDRYQSDGRGWISHWAS